MVKLSCVNSITVSKDITTMPQAMGMMYQLGSPGERTHEDPMLLYTLIVGDNSWLDNENSLTDDLILHHILLQENSNKEKCMKEVLILAISYKQQNR